LKREKGTKEREEERVGFDFPVRKGKKILRPLDLDLKKTN